VRPRQIYKGHTRRDYEEASQRAKKVDQDLDYEVAPTDVRRESALEHQKKGKKAALNK